MPKRPDGLIRAFGMSGLQIVSDMKAIEKDSGHDLAVTPKSATDRKVSEYEQFEAQLRAEAARMSEFYEVFYCLENSIRKLVKGIMIEAEGADWWQSVRVDENKIRNPARGRHKKEVDSGITPRSDDLIDYTTFGELSQLITDNWDIFDPVFSSKIAVSNIANQLNLLRGPIAHCNATDELEQDRLNLAVQSWFKLMS
ncbi:Swt1 family HEPN domain-containing protein [Hoeflea sp. YIM 152468]|uniref:Swt1 family HEPN domain-containing protein n=1 Tax=Hoeflea sp. YIM 152468 TaxID=3031759 RepID=UPI0023DADB75|nr:Swt1 family HEPN domain-containing protein [Hoeflea sp. YIM 152468]MDF1608365.1 Swt1 family HEPN domain-containing protein [Hoeflea sp. YIM 152468]